MKTLLHLIINLVLLTSPQVESTTCHDTSYVLKEFLTILKNDKYEIQEIDIDSLVFKSENGDRISFKKEQFKSFRAKRIHEIPNSDKKFYPGFEVYEICLDSEIKTQELENRIQKIINSRDRYNLKQYDYVLKNNDRLIYVLSRAKVFEKYAFGYREKLKENIKN